MSAVLDIFVAEKRFGSRTVLRDLHLAVNDGEIVTVVGASGCGKSTLLAIVAGLDPQFQGRIALAGKPRTGIHADIGFVFQEPRLFPWLTVAQNIAFGQGPAAQDDPRVDALLAQVGLDGYRDALPKQLSGGQAQRVSIARGLFMQPRVLLLDEPFSAVDAFTRVKLQDLLVKVAHEHKLTLLMVTHDIDEALFVGDRVVLLDGTAGPLRAQFKVEAARPRRRNDPAAGELKAALLHSLERFHAA